MTELFPGFLATSGARLFDPIADWRNVARDVTGKRLPCGHYRAEEAPEETLAEMLAFF